MTVTTHEQALHFNYGSVQFMACLFPAEYQRIRTREPLAIAICHHAQRANVWRRAPPESKAGGAERPHPSAVQLAERRPGGQGIAAQRRCVLCGGAPAISTAVDMVWPPTEELRRIMTRAARAPATVVKATARALLLAEAGNGQRPPSPHGLVQRFRREPLSLATPL